MVRELFVMAREHAPSIIFMDEIDSIGSSRLEGGSGGDSEVQRTMLELLNQLDGFEATKNIKVIMATNRADTLDPALLRPGRLDRKIEFPPPGGPWIRTPPSWGSTTGSNYYVRILSTIDRELLKPNASVALHKHSNALVDVLPPEADSSIMMLSSDQKPDVMYADIGGMDIQKQEVREAVGAAPHPLRALQTDWDRSPAGGC